MPTSDPMHLQTICTLLFTYAPKTVLEVGIGYGKWGHLIREYVDCWVRKEILPSQWSTWITGIESYSKYRNPAWDNYNLLVIEDARTALPATKGEKSFDLCLMVDVLEHFSREDGLQIIEHLRRLGKNVILTYSNTPQSGVCDNDKEDHISTWSPGDFPDHSIIHSGENWGVVIFES